MDNFKGVRFVLIYTMILNLVATAAKMAAGYLTGSLSLLADGFDSLFDSLSNVIGLIAIYVARRPPDEDHPYGHRRYEILMTLSIAVLLFLTCFELLKSAYQRLTHPITPQITIWSFASLLLSVGVHIYVAVYEKRKGEQLRSEFLVADAMHTQADIFVSVGVMAGLVVVRMGYPILDTVIAVVIAAMIAKIGIEIISSSTRVLTDAAAVDVDKVLALVREVPGVTSCHHVRSRGQEDDIHLDLHIRVAPDMPLAQAHMIAHQVQRKLQDAIVGTRDVVVHVEPQPSHGESQQDSVLVGVRKIAQELEASIHHLHVHEINGRYSIDLHLEVPSDLSLGEAHARVSSLEDRIRAAMPQVADVSTHIEPLTAQSPACNPTGDEEIAEIVRKAVGEVAQVRDCHGIQYEWVQGRLFLSMHCTLDGHLPIGQAHDITTLIEDHLRRDCPSVEHVLIHVEPAGPEGAGNGGKA